MEKKGLVSGISEESLIKMFTPDIDCLGNHVVKGIGDDTAVIDCENQSEYYWLLTQDSVVDGKHFLIGDTDPYRVGWKSVARSISDIAAMAGEPVGVLVALGLTKNIEVDWIKKVYSGINACISEYGCFLIGGDVSSCENEVFLSVTVLGKVRKNKVCYRAGATRDDFLCVTGDLGGSILRKHLDFTPRIKESIWLTDNLDVTSMIDLSDGLGKDIFHLVEEGSVGFRLDYEAIPISDDAKKMAENDINKSFHRALNDGEDYELLFTVSGESVGVRRKLSEFREIFGISCSVIGRVIEGVNGVEIFKGDKFHSELKKGGFEHFGEN